MAKMRNSDFRCLERDLFGESDHESLMSFRSHRQDIERARAEVPSSAHIHRVGARITSNVGFRARKCNGKRKEYIRVQPSSI